jgi:hypothetical protein
MRMTEDLVLFLRKFLSRERKAQKKILENIFSHDCSFLGGGM